MILSCGINVMLRESLGSAMQILETFLMKKVTIR